MTGDLKLSYSQFEEMESFARFGTRLDESTRKIIDHGRRIRECLKQTESHPVPLADQIVVLFALAVGLFDAIPLEAMAAAETALRTATADLAADVIGRFTSADHLSPEDRAALLALTTRALVPFQPAPQTGAANPASTVNTAKAATPGKATTV